MAKNSEQPTVLVVDDDNMNLKMAEMILKKAGPYKILLAASGLQCIDILQHESVDLVLLDIKMPIMDGIKTLELMRKRADLKDIPVIFLTASSDRETVVKAGLMGVKDYIKKPFMPQDLQERVEKALGPAVPENPEQETVTDDSKK